MPRHKDFEIWYDEETQRYRFSVEYWGSYGAKTLEEIQERRNRVRSQVAKRLREIERQNQEYYKRLAAKEEKLKRELREAKSACRAESVVRYKDLTAKERIKLLQMVCNGADELEIKKLFPVNSSTIASLRTASKRDKNVCKTLQKNETLSDSSRCGIIMPSYTADVIGNDRLGDE